MTAGDGPAAMVLDLAVKPTINLSVVRGHMATALHDLGEDQPLLTSFQQVLIIDDKQQLHLSFG